MFGLHRALMAQRNELKAVTAALSDFRFGFDPLMGVMDRFPFSLIEVQTGGAECRTFSGVPWIAVETVRMAITKDTCQEIEPVVNALTSLSGLPWRPSVARSAATYVPCRIWVAYLVGQPLFRNSTAAVTGARDIVLRWQGFASWEN